MSLVKIVVPEDGRAYGTKVLLEDGSELEGVTKIVLTATPGDMWKAEIHCYALAEQVVAEANIIDSTPPRPKPCECETHCKHATVFQPPCRPGTYCRERAAKVARETSRSRRWWWPF